ncbi:unnamed protein product [Withania somnifera]
MGNGENSTELLDLKMKTSESSYPYNKRTMFMAPSSYPSHFFAPCGKESGDDGGSGGGGPGSDVYEVVSSGAALSSRPLQQPFNTTTARGSMGLAPLTASQLQEFQRQSKICKYIMASMPVPPYLLLPLPNNPSPVHFPQSNTSGLDLKFSSGSDPEPWRCKRTDGKKWRCSRDVAPDQKYCERHAHKSRPRSRKPVEIHTNNNHHSNRYPPTPKSTSFPTVHLPAPSSDQTRCIEWLGRGDRSGTIPVVTCNKQLMQSSSGMGFNTDQNRSNTPAFQVRDESKDRGTTSDLIDAWSKDGLSDGIGNSGSFTSLTLSISGWSRPMDDDNEHTPGSIGMLDSDSSSDEILRSQWLNPVSWMNSTAPGGPLGEALCLGSATNLPSPHGYSSTAASSCSFGSCDNGSHAFDFIG